MATEALTYDILARDQLSEALEKIAKVAAKVDRQLATVAKAGREAGEGLDKAEKSADQLGREMAETSRQATTMMDRLKSAGRAARGVGDHFNWVGGMVRSGVAGIATGVASLGVVAAATGATLAGIGLKTAANIETATITFTTLLKSGEKARAFMAEIQRFAAATPFELPGLQTAASQMLAAGFAARDIIPMLTRLGNATSAMGTGSEGIDRAVYALNQMKGAGRVTAEEMNQLTEAGILGWDALAAQMHKSQKEVRELVSAGKVQPNTLFDAILNGKGRMGEFAGMMEQQSKTLSGLWSSFKDNASQSLAGVMEPAIGPIKGVLDWLSDSIPKAIGKMQEVGGRIKEIFAGMHIGDDIQAIWQKFAGQGADDARAALERFIGIVQDNKYEIKQAIEMIATAFIFLGTQALPALAMAMGDLISMIGAVVDAYNYLANKAMQAFQLILDAAVQAAVINPALQADLKRAADSFREFRERVNGELGRINNNIPITLKVNTTYTGGARQILSGHAIAGLASGGPAAAGQVIRVGEHGPETLLMGGNGQVLTNQQTNAMAMGGGGEFVLRVIHETPDGRLIREELLRFKRTSGQPSLGLG